MIADEKNTMFAPFAYQGSFDKFQPFHAESYPNEPVLPPLQEESESDFDEQFLRRIFLPEIYSPTVPAERVLTEEERQKVSRMRKGYFRLGEMADGLPITTRRPTRPRQMSYDPTQTPTRSPTSGASKHPHRFLKWTAIVAGATLGTAVALLLFKPKNIRKK